LRFLAKGALLDRAELPDLRQNSIRHLAQCGGAITFALQWVGYPSEAVPQLGLRVPGQVPVLCEPRPEDAFAMQGHAGSTAATGDRVLVTSPRGGVATILAGDGTPVAFHRRADLCVAAVAAGGFVVTEGLGAVWAADDDGLFALARGRVRWDNHPVAPGA